MKMVPVVHPLWECMAPRYAAAHCRLCGASDQLKLVGDDFECSNPARCVANRFPSVTRSRKRRRRTRR